MQITARRFTSLSSCPRSRREFFEVSHAALQSNNQWCWSSSVAVSSDSFTPQHVQKKVTKQERSAMVFSFVEKYRALNGGKFPSASCTQKQVGGSYYVIREIIQELEHNHKRASLETKKEVKIRGEIAKCEDLSLTEKPCILADAKQSSFKEFASDTTKVRNKHSSNKAKEGDRTSRLSIEAHSENQIEIDAHKQLTPSRVSKESREDKGMGFDNVHASSSPSASATVKRQTHTSGTSDADAMNADDRVSAKLETETSILHTLTEESKVCGKDVASATNLQDACCPEGKKMSNQEVFRSEELYHGQRQMFELGEPSTKRSNFWGNLKSMAVGIINLWKK